MSSSTAHRLAVKSTTTTLNVGLQRRIARWAGDSRRRQFREKRARRRARNYSRWQPVVRLVYFISSTFCVTSVYARTKRTVSNEFVPVPLRAQQAVDAKVVRPLKPLDKNKTKLIVALFLGDVHETTTMGRAFAEKRTDKGGVQSQDGSI